MLMSKIQRRPLGVSTSSDRFILCFWLLFWNNECSYQPYKRIIGYRNHLKCFSFLKWASGEFSLNNLEEKKIPYTTQWLTFEWNVHIHVYQLCQRQNIVADKVTVKQDPGSSPNSQCEVNSACVGLQNTHTLHPTTSTWSTFVLAYLNKPTAMMRIFFTPACFIHSSRRKKKVQHWSTPFFFSPTRAYPGKISSRIYRLMFTFDSLLQVWEAKAPKLISGHKVKSSRCVITFKQTSYSYGL